MKHENRWRGFIRTSALFAVVVILLFCLTDCNGCRPKKKGTAKEERQPDNAMKTVDRHAGRRKLAPRPANALDKIAAAEKAGIIDLDQAWTYKVQALVDPGKLPARIPARVARAKEKLKIFSGKAKEGNHVCR